MVPNPSRLGALLLAFTLCPTLEAAQPVLQRGYDAGVSGATLTETTLTATNVSPSRFGLVFKLSVDDTIYAQPLYVPNVAVANHGTHNVVYVATMSDTLYAFDADAGGTALWSVNVASRVGAAPVSIASFTFSGNRNIVGNLGILSTPIIEPSTNIMYLVAATLENKTIAYRLHAVDIRSGAEPYGPGVLISGSFGGSTFDARYQLQRVSLGFSGNRVVLGFGAIELEYSGGYVGWVMAYDKQTLKQGGIFATVTTGGRGGGVWQSGRPPAVDSSGYVYVFTGNGWGGGYDGVKDFSESVLKLDPAHGLRLIDWFTPGNWSTLDAQDLDLASSGPLLIPGTSLLAGGGKTGDFYVLNTGNLGKYNKSDSQVVQKLHISASEFRGGPVYWQRSAANGGPLLYNWGVSDGVKAYAFNGAKFASSPTSQGGGTQVWPGGILALSANGEQHGSGVLWATVVTSGNAEDNPPAPGELRAFNAENLSQELWNSSMNASRDGLGNFAKFVPPLIANGRVYAASWSKQVAVYGLLSAPSSQQVSLATVANIDGIFIDGKTVASSGLDGASTSYSGNALGTALTWSGVPFKFGAPDTLNSVANRQIPLPAAKSSALRFLATAVYGAKLSQRFTVTYTDGTSVTTPVNLSDWCYAQHYSDEATVKTMTLRDRNNGTVLHDCSSVNLYGYSLALNATKTVKSLGLPANSQVVVLAVTLVP